MIRPGLQLRHDTKIGAQEATSELGNEFLSGSFAAVRL